MRNLCRGTFTLPVTPFQHLWLLSGRQTEAWPEVYSAGSQVLHEQHRGHRRCPRGWAGSSAHVSLSSKHQPGEYAQVGRQQVLLTCRVLVGICASQSRSWELRPQENTAACCRCLIEMSEAISQELTLLVRRESGSHLSC